MARRKSIHYVNNADFSAAVMAYVKEVRAAKEAEEPLPIVTDYIANCFLRLAEGLSHSSNFVRYTYREEMVMDAVENCLKAIENYNIEAATRTGKPNAFSYFTQISWYAFLRRIAKEKKQQDTKMKYISQSGVDTLAMINPDDKEAAIVAAHFVDMLKDRIDKVKEVDAAVKDIKKKEKRKKRERKPKATDSDLSAFLE